MAEVAFQDYIGRSGIFLERGLVCDVKVLEVAELNPGGKGTEFTLQIMGTISTNASPLGSNFDRDISDLKVGSVNLDESDDIIFASGYISWTLIFNPELMSEVRRRIQVMSSASDRWDAYRICRDTMKDRGIDR